MSERADPESQIAIVAGPCRVTLVAEIRLGRAVGAECIRVPTTRRRSALARTSSYWPIIDASVPPLTPPCSAVTTSVVPSGRRRHRRGLRGAAAGRQGRTGPSRTRSCARCARRGRGHLVAAVDAVPDEQRLAGQVRVVGPLPGAGLNQRQPPGAVRTHLLTTTRADRASAASDTGSPNRRSAAARPTRPRQPCPYIGQPLPGPSRKPDADAAGRMTGQVTGDQPPPRTRDATPPRPAHGPRSPDSS